MSFWGKLGKIALKVAPYAAMAIPGVGVPLGMAISGAAGVANKKLSGGSWKNSLLSGGIDAGLAGVGGGFGKGLAPTSKILGKTAGDVAKTTAKSSVKSVLGNIGKNILTGGSGGTPPYSESTGIAGQNSGGWQDMLGSVLGKYKTSLDAGQGPSVYQGNGPTGVGGIGPTRAPGSMQPQMQSPMQSPGAVMPRGGYRYNQNPMNQLDQSNPNLSQSIFQGRQEVLNPRPKRQLQAAY